MHAFSTLILLIFREVRTHLLSITTAFPNPAARRSMKLFVTASLMIVRWRMVMSSISTLRVI
jgi:hypothetical protein